jgi:hypothetical protein
MEAEAYRGYELKAPYIAPKMAITPEDLEKKAFGEDPNSNRSPADRENEVEAEHMDELREAVLRTHELMCTSIITEGKVLMKHYASADDAAKDRNAMEMEFKYYDDTFENKYQFSKDFTTMTAQERILEFYKIAQILKSRHVKVTDIVMTSDVSMLLMTDPDFLDYYDKARVRTGEINQTETPDGVTSNGSININGVIFTMFTYDESYEALDGSVKEFLPKGTIAFLAPGLGTTVYAQTTFVEGDTFKSYAEKIVPRVRADENNNLVEIQVFSRPVPYPRDWESWMVANIYDSTNSVSTLSDDTAVPAGETELKSEEEINALKTKAEVIAYGESIGMTGLSDSDSLANLKTAVIEYQNSEL